MSLKPVSRVHDDEQGFTLIELLVVVIIVGILAAIAIPVFLNQREKGWQGAVKSDLRNHAIIMETQLTDAGTYVGAPEPEESDGVTVTVVEPSATTYCLEGFHENNEDQVWSLVPGGGDTLQEAACADRAA